MLRKCIPALLLAVAAIVVMPTASAQTQDEHAYTEGPVIVVSYIRTEPGKFEDYMKYLATTYKTLMEEYKKSGLILDYAVFNAEPRNPGDPDLLLTITYKNYASLDNLNEKTDPIDRKVWGSIAKSSEESAARGKLRTLVGGQTIRQLLLK